MKILHIISSAAAGGAEIYVKDLSIEMSKMGHEVFIVFIDRAEEAGRDLEFEKKFLEELQSHGIGFSFIGQSARKNIFKGVFLLHSIVRAFSPDILHSHLYYGSIFSWFINGVRRVYTHHNIKLGAPNAIYKFLDIRFDTYIGICAACTKLLRNTSGKNVAHIDNGVDDTRLLKKIDYPESSPVKLLFVGRLSAQKNLGLLIRSAARIKDADFELIIAGEGPLMLELKKLAQEKNIGEKIKFIGNSDNVKKLLHEADAFVMSSAWEGLPIAQIEATLTGLPVLVTDVGGCSEIVEYVGNGEISTVDEDVYADCLERLIKDFPMRKQYHEHALRNSGKYTIEVSVKKHIELYKSIL